MIKAKQIATSVAAAFVLGYGASALAFVAAPGAVAEGMLSLTNFRICAGDGVNNLSTANSCQSAAAPVLAADGTVTSGNGLTFSPVPAFLNPLGLAGVLGSESLSASASLNGAAPTTVSNSNVAFASTFTALATQGAGFTPGVPIPALAPTGQYAGGISSTDGFALSPAGATVLMHSQTQLNSFGSESIASSLQQLNATFNFAITQTTRVELSFDAARLLRAGLGQPGIDANADTSFGVSIFSVLNPVFDTFSWDPNGPGGGCSASGAITCSEMSDAFNLNNPLGNVGLPIDLGTIGAAIGPGYFEVEVVLPAGLYTLSIAGQTQADASIFAVPEPHSLALLGIGLLGLGLSARRRFGA